MNYFLLFFALVLLGCYAPRKSEINADDPVVIECNKELAMKIADKEFLELESEYCHRVRITAEELPDSGIYRIFYAPAKQTCSGGDATVWISNKTCRIIKTELGQ